MPSALGRQQNMAGRLLQSAHLLTLEFGSDVVLSSDPHVFILTLLSRLLQHLFYCVSHSPFVVKLQARKYCPFFSSSPQNAFLYTLFYLGRLKPRVLESALVLTKTSSLSTWSSYLGLLWCVRQPWEMRKCQLFCISKVSPSLEVWFVF